MQLKEFVNKRDKFIYENNVFRVTTIVLSLTIVALMFILFYKIETQKVVVIPPTETLKEFWVQGDKVSSSYLEIMADVLTNNVLNVSAEKKFNIDFLMAMVPTEYFSKVKSEIVGQMKYIQDNGITQVFYATKYETNMKGLIVVQGILKQYIGPKMVDSSVYTLSVPYRIEHGRFWIIGLNFQKNGETQATQQQ